MMKLQRLTSPLIITTVTIATLLTSVTSQDDSALHHIYANYSGDLLLAGFFPIHQSIAATSDIACGEVQEQDGIQALEMFFYALDKVNENGILPNFTLGGVAFDSCDDELHALQQGVDLVASLMSRSGYNQNSYICKDGTKPDISPSARDLHKIFSIVGGSSSTVTISLASFFTLFTLPQISYLATSTDLSNKERYPHFKRTVPSDSVQARAIITLLQSFNWTYVSVIYEDTNYGSKGFGELEDWAETEGICFASTNRLAFTDPTWTDRDYDDVIENILEEEKAKVVILYVDHPRARKVFEAAARYNVTNITWIGSDAWSGRSFAVEGLEEIANGAITLQPYAYISPGFDDYFKGLTMQSNERNPWFGEFWESHFDCTLINEDVQKMSDCDVTHCKKPSYPDVMQIKTMHVKSMTEFCNGSETIGDNSGYYQQNYLHFIGDAVLAYTYALKDIHTDLCGKDYVGLCPEMSAANLTGEIVSSHLENLTFTAISGLPFNFYQGNDGPPRYTILNYLYNPVRNSGSWTTVGSYSGVSGEHDLHLDEDFVEQMLNSTRSLCSLPCAVGEARQFLQPQQDQCCWICTSCNDDAIVIKLPMISDRCFACDDGSYPNENRDICVSIEATYLNYNHGAAIGTMVFSTIGIIATVFTFAIFIVYGSTPVVKASGRELSFYLLAAITLAFSSTFLIVHRPTKAICGTTRVLVGLCFTMMYASILTKTNRISRIFNGGGQKGKRAKYTSPKSQIIIVNILVIVELLVVGSWLIISPPGVTHVYPHRLANVLVCAGEEGATYLIALVYPAILLFCSTVYAFMTRKTPDGFNETQHVGIVSYTTMVILLALIPIYFLTEDPGIKTVSICFTLSLTAAVVLCVIFVPKIYICIFRPNKNTKEAIMQRTTSVLSSVSENYQRDRSHSRAASCSFCGKESPATRDTGDYKAVVLSPEQLEDTPEINDNKIGSNNNHDNPKDPNNHDVTNETEGDFIITSQNDINKLNDITINSDVAEHEVTNRNTESEKESNEYDIISPQKRLSACSVSFADDVNVISETRGSLKDITSSKSNTSIPEDSGIMEEQIDIILSEDSDEEQNNMESVT